MRQRVGVIGSGGVCKPGNGAGRKQAGFHPKKGTINAPWLSDSGSVAIAPNSGTLRTGIETMKDVKALGLLFAAGAAGGCR
jgi:hypothetical protein